MEVVATETPGVSLIIWRKSRPFIGRSETVFWSTTPVSVVDDVSTVSTAAETATLDACDASGSRKLMLATRDTSISASLFCSVKPSFRAETVYLPGGRSGTEKSPAAPERVARETPVPLFVAVTLAPARAAPEGSSTVPFTEPRKVCAARDPASTRAKIHNEYRFIASHPREVESVRRYGTSEVPRDRMSADTAN